MVARTLHRIWFLLLNTLLDLPTPEGWKAELTDLGYPAMQRPGVELAIFRSIVRCPNHYTPEPPVLIFNVEKMC